MEQRTGFLGGATDSRVYGDKIKLVAFLRPPISEPFSQTIERMYGHNRCWRIHILDSTAFRPPV